MFNPKDNIKDCMMTAVHSRLKGPIHAQAACRPPHNIWPL